ncbi:MAG: hypothetical protein AB8B50_14385 [Pirellulaceae bacterium]
MRRTKEFELRLGHYRDPVAEATVRCELQDGTVVLSESEENGIAEVKLIEGETIDRMVAWTRQNLVGGIPEPSALMEAQPLKLSTCPCSNYDI